MEPTFTLSLLLGLALILMAAFAYEVFLHKNTIRKLEKDIQEYVEKLKQAEIKQYANLEEIRLLKWQIANPAKYKKGDKFGDLEVQFFYVRKPKLSEFLADALIGLISICAGFEREKKKSIDLDLRWEYQLIHAYHGDKIKMSESELTHLSNKKE